MSAGAFDMKSANTLALVIAFHSAVAFAQAVPQQISFTGNLTGSGGPVTGQHNFVFTLYDHPTNSTGLAWTESYTGAAGLTVNNGLVFANLGSVNPFTPVIFNGAQLYLEISVNGTVLSPRLAINSVPYAVRAGAATMAERLGTLLPSDLQRRVTGTCAAGGIASIDAAGGVTCNPPPAPGVTSITAGAGLTGGTITSTGTIALASPVATNNGGTGLTSGPTAIGQYLRSSGPGTWAVGGISASDLPSLSSTYVDLSSTQTVAGAKTFSSTIIGSITGNAQGTASGFTGALGGDVTGGQVATVVGRIQGRPVSNASPAIGQALIWNGTTWVPTNVLPAPVGFASSMTTTQTIPYNTTQVLAFDAETYDPGNNFNTATGEFTVPSAGFYHFDCAFIFSTAGTSGNLRMYIGGDLVQRYAPIQAFEHITITTDRFYNAGSVITCRLYSALNGSGSMTISSSFSRFSGFKVH